MPTLNVVRDVFQRTLDQELGRLGTTRVLKLFDNQEMVR